MNDKPDRKFYITMQRKDGETVGHMVSLDPPSLPPAEPSKTGTQPKPSSEDGKRPTLEFESVCRDFVSSMESYRKFVTLILATASVLSTSLAEKKMGDFVKARGVARIDLSTDDDKVYELDINCYREFSAINDEVLTALGGARNLPQVMIIGLVSAYDAFLSQLLRVVLNKHEEIVLTSEKTIKFSELSQFASIEHARTTLIDREIESVIRESHHEQIAWMEKRLSITLRKDLAIWPKFIELCERRNLLTHTGGIVSDQYITNCKAQGVDVSSVKAGTRLRVSAQYYSEAVSTVYEMGVKLCHVLWRKFSKEEREDADKALLALGYDLICAREYPIAETLLRFATSTIKIHAKDQFRRMMVVNLANAVRLQKRESEAKKILEAEDWSAASDEFKICVAAASGQKKEVLDLMSQIGPDGKPTAEDYRTWPIFRGMRTDEDFLETFEKTFREPLIAPSRVEISAEAVVEAENSDTALSPHDSETKH